MPDFEWVTMKLKQPQPRFFVVDYMGVQSVFVEDLNNTGQFHGTVNGIRVLVDWQTPKYALYVDAPDGRITYTGAIWNISALDVPIKNAIADIYMPTMYDRFRNNLTYEYTATPTGFLLVYDEIYIIRFNDGSGWFYATGEMPDDRFVSTSAAYLPDVTPSMEHCIAAFTQGKFNGGGNE